MALNTCKCNYLAPLHFKGLTRTFKIRPNFSNICCRCGYLRQTGNALSFFLHNVASNPDKQDKLFAEIQHFLPDPSTVLTGDMLQKMVYLKAAAASSSSTQSSSGLPQGLPSRILSSALSRVWWIRSSHARRYGLQWIPSSKRGN